MKKPSRTKGPVRASISFPRGIYQTLERLARQKKVSLAWVVREAAERYVAEETAESGGRETQAVLQNYQGEDQR
jgi:metal-responsive CopG/Arc/MetJ family transcriptional regulator